MQKEKPDYNKETIVKSKLLFKRRMNNNFILKLRQEKHQQTLRI